MASLLVGLLMLGATSKEECAKAHDQAQRLQLDGKLKAARERAMFCAAEACPALVRRECITIAEELVRKQPSVLVSVRVAGADVTGAKVQLDGDEFVVTGRPVTVDPGEHVVVATLEDGRRLQSRFLAMVGEQERAIALEAPALEPAREPPRAETAAAEAARPPSRRPIGVVISSFVTAGLLASFIGFSLHGRSLEDQAAASCLGACPPERLAPIRQDYAVGDLSLLGAVIALGVTVALVIVYARGGA